MTTKETRALASSKLNAAVQSGRIVRQPCEVCGSTTKVEAHHDDYSKPLKVRWLCRQHHYELHGRRLRLGPVREVRLNLPAAVVEWLDEQAELTGMKRRSTYLRVLLLTLYRGEDVEDLIVGGASIGAENGYQP